MEHDLTFDFSFEVQGKIWQLAIDEATANLAIEVRDADSQEVSFLIFNLATFDVSDYFESVYADWWTTLKAVVNHSLLLDQYEDPQDPTRKNLLVFNTDQNEVKTVTDFQLRDIEHHRIMGVSALDMTKTKAISFTEVGIEIAEKQYNKSITFPVFHPEGSEVFLLCQAYLEENIALGVEYWEQGESIIFSYYQKQSSKFDRKLVFIRNEMEIIHEFQDEGLEGYASGSFFVSHDHLVFIGHSNQINGVKI